MRRTKKKVNWVTCQTCKFATLTRRRANQNNKMKILHLVLKAQWYNLIEQGVKEEEYRDITPYYDKRLRNADGSFKHFDAVCFHYGYTNKTMTYKIADIFIGEGVPSWGAQQNKKYYVIKLGKKI